MKNTYNEDEEF